MEYVYKIVTCIYIYIYSIYIYINNIYIYISKYLKIHISIYIYIHTYESIYGFMDLLYVSYVPGVSRETRCGSSS